VSRKEFLETLQSAMITESASALAIRNMASTFTWSGLSEEQRTQVTSQLEKLADSSQRRTQRLKELIAQVQGSNQDVF
jgi:predicted Fe-S protein YdhL (DUF1289 family)